jgi:hypothetical protein
LTPCDKELENVFGEKERAFGALRQHRAEHGCCLSGWRRIPVRQLKALIHQQHKDLDDLSAEIQRKQITPERIVRLMKMVQRNLEISERIVTLMERSGMGVIETEEESKAGFRTPLQ